MTSVSQLKRICGWALLVLTILSIAAVSSRYLTLDPDVYFDKQRDVYIAHTLGITVHVAGAVLALLLGPWQFIRRLRVGRYRRLHRWSGRLYVLAVMIGGAGGLYMASLAYGGWISAIGFTCLAVAWLVTGSFAFVRIRQRAIAAHRRWMLRNYALTMAAVTLRLYIPILVGVGGLDFIDAYRTVAWLSWIPNLLLIEWIVRRDRVAG